MLRRSWRACALKCGRRRPRWCGLSAPIVALLTPAQTPLRERLAVVSQKAAHLTEQAAAFDAQLSQSTELLVAASTPLKPRTPSRLSMIAATGAMPSPLSLSSPAPVAPECDSATEADAELEEETAEIIRTNPLVQSTPCGPLAVH